MEFVVRAVLIGIGGTVVMDLWAAFLKRFFGVRIGLSAIIAELQQPAGAIAHAARLHISA
jgi:hypothetical protein